MQHSSSSSPDGMQEGDIPASFGNAGTLRQAQEQGCLLADLSHWGRLRISGRDALQFLHQQSSADFLSLQPGSGCTTVCAFVLQMAPHVPCMLPWHASAALPLSCTQVSYIVNSGYCGACSPAMLNC